MRRLSLLPLLLILAVALPAAAQSRGIDFNPQGISFANGKGISLWGQSPMAVAPANLQNSSRVNSLLRNGKLYLSLNDAIALALENNLDIVLARYNQPLADTELMQAKSGASPGGAVANLYSGTPGGSAGGGGGAVGAISAGGPAVPDLDPTFSASFNLADNVQPLGNTVVSGIPTVQTHQGVANFSFSKGFITGGSISVGYNNTRSSTNSTRNLFNPQVSSGLAFSFSQPLLQGFGIGLNSRNLVIANDNREITDIAFSQQVMSTVSQIEDLYWNVVTASESVRNAQESVDYAQTTVNNTQRQVEVGTMAPLQIAQAEATLATSQQSLIAAQNTLQYDSLLLKNAVTKNMSNPVLASADVVTTDTINVPTNQPIQPVSDLVRLALQYRPELAETRINMAESQINLKAAENTLMPTLDLTGSYNANSLAASYGNTFSDVFQGNYPSYAVGFTLQIPLHNRPAQAAVARAELQYQQAHVQQQQQINNIVISVEQAQFALQSARAQVLAGRKAVTYNRETLNADQKKLDLGATTLTQVILDESNLTAAESSLTSAESTYAQSKVTLDLLTGRTLANNRISILDAENGKITQMPKANF